MTTPFDGILKATEVENTTSTVFVDVSDMSQTSWDNVTTTLNGLVNRTEFVNATTSIGSVITNDSLQPNDTSNQSTNNICIICSHAIPVWVSVIQAVVGVFVTLANVITVTALIRSTGLKKIQKILLINQLIIDTIVGLIYTYHAITVYIIWHSPTECIIRYAILCTASAVSLTIVALLSVERIVAIQLPYKYQDLNTTINQMWACFFCWFSPTLTIVLGFMYADWDIYECNFLLLVTPTTLLLFGAPSLLIVMVIIICNLILLHIATGHIRKIIPNFVGRDKYIKGIKLHLKATLTTASIVAPFLLTNIPQYIYFIVLAVYPHLRSELWALYLLNVVSSLVLLNSVINPIVYVWRIDDLRLKLLRLLCPSMARDNIKAPYM